MFRDQERKVLKFDLKYVVLNKVCVKLKPINAMNYLMLGAFGVNAVLVVVLMVAFYQSIKDELNSGIRKFNHYSRRHRKNQKHNVMYNDQKQNDRNENDFNNWDLSGGILGI